MKNNVDREPKYTNPNRIDVDEIAIGESMTYIINPGSTGRISQGDNCYDLKSSSPDQPFKIPSNLINRINTHDIILPIKIYQWIVSKFSTNDQDIPLDQMHALRQYDKMDREDKELISLLAQHNNMTFKVSTVESYIKEHFFEIIGVAHKIDHEIDISSETPDKQFGDLPAEMQQKVFSYMKISYVLLNHETTPNVDHIGDLPPTTNDY